MDAIAGALDIATLRPWLSERLPDYMLPASFTVLDALPLTPNGKTDRKALPEPEGLSVARSSIPPRDLLELRLLQAWQAVLPVNALGVHGNFFELGRHSLLAVRLMQHIQQQFGHNLPVSLLFQHPTVAQLAGVLRQDATQAAASGHCIPIHAPADTAAPTLFLLPGAVGSVLYLQPLAAALGGRYTLYALQTPGSHDDQPTPESVEALAACHIKALRTNQPKGP